MGQDKYGNYTPTLPPLAPHTGGKFGTLTFGSGAPVGTPTSFQAAYVDTTGGAIYVNQGGVWTILSAGGGGGTPQVISGAGQPVANPGVSNAVYTDTTTGNHWYWYGGAWH